MGRFDGQAVIITGAGGEIGFATAIRLGGEGAAITVVDFHQERGDAALARLCEAGVDARLSVGDVGDPATAEAAVEATMDACGRIDILVNNAGGGGVADYGNIWELPADALDVSFRNNFMGAFHFTSGCGSAHDGAGLRPHRQHCVRCRQGREPAACAVLRF